MSGIQTHTFSTIARLSKACKSVENRKLHIFKSQYFLLVNRVGSKNELIAMFFNTAISEYKRDFKNQQIAILYVKIGK